MDTIAILATFAVIHLAAVASPGPSFAVVLRAAMARGRAAGVWISLGLGLGTLVWAAGAWFGLAALFEVAPMLERAIRWAGAAYLVYLAVMMWRHAADPVPLASGGAVGTRGALAGIRQGVLTQLANPKVAVFFGSVFVAILPGEPSAAMLAAVFAIVFLNEFLWYAGVALVMSSGRMRAGYTRAKPVVDLVAGTFLGALGLRLIAD